MDQRSGGQLDNLGNQNTPVPKRKKAKPFVLASCPSTSSDGGAGFYEEVPRNIKPKRKYSQIPEGYVDVSHPTQSQRNLLPKVDLKVRTDEKEIKPDEEVQPMKRKRKKKKILINLHYT